MKKFKKIKKISFFSIVAVCLVGIAYLGFYHQLNRSSQADRGKNYASKSKRIIVTNPSIGTTLYAIEPTKANFVGMSDWIYQTGNKEILSKVFPSIYKLNTDFINHDFKVNLETLMSLKPNFIFYYGKYQDDGLERSGAKTINLEGSTQNPKTLQIMWEKKYCKTLGIPYTHKYEKAWAHIDSLISNKKRKPLKVLYINKLGKEISIAAAGTTEDYYLKETGLENVAKNIHIAGNGGRNVNVSMEEIYKWNPDMIVINLGSAKQILNNTVSGQDWSKLKAVRDGKVYASPVGISTWGILGADSPLMPVWLESKADPDLVSETVLRNETKQYYQRMFNYKLNDQALNSILKNK